MLWNDVTIHEHTVSLAKASLDRRIDPARYSPETPVRPSPLSDNRKSNARTANSWLEPNTATESERASERDRYGIRKGESKTSRENTQMYWRVPNFSTVLEGANLSA